MSDDEDFDDLPKIYFNSSDIDTSSFNLPSAEQLASQRKTEVECKRKLEQLELLADDGVGHDSSSSDSDAGLAAAAALSLRVHADAQPRAELYAPRAAHLLAALAPHVPAAARAPLAHPDAARRLPELVTRAGALLAADGEAWPDGELCAFAALLVAAALARDLHAPRAPALRALHALLEHRASPAQAQLVARSLAAALPAPRARLELSDALRAGGGPACRAAAGAVLDAALLDALGAAPAPAPGLARLADAMEAGWPRLDAARQYAVLQLLGRRLAGAGAGAAAERARLLAPLAATVAGHDRHRPDKLKVQVAAWQLRLLFGTEK